MTLTYTVVCLLCALAGWLGHVAWTGWKNRGERYEHPGCYPINDPFDDDDPITRALIESDRDAHG